MFRRDERGGPGRDRGEPGGRRSERRGAGWHARRCATAAAPEDPRFPRVTPAEVADLRIEISVLTPLLPIRPEDVTVGVHGFVSWKGGNRVLLLQQVAVEYGWDRQTFFSQVCAKANLPPDAWKEDAELHSFTAEAFAAWRLPLRSFPSVAA